MCSSDLAVAEVMLDEAGVAVRDRSSVSPKGVAEIRAADAAGVWRNVLVEFAPGELGIAVDGLPFLRVPAKGLSPRRHEGFALVRLAGEVAFRDVWATAGEPLAAEAVDVERARRGKAVKAKAAAP